MRKRAKKHKGVLEYQRVGVRFIAKYTKFLFSLTVALVVFYLMFSIKFNFNQDISFVSSQSIDPTDKEKILKIIKFDNNSLPEKVKKIGIELELAKVNILTLAPNKYIISVQKRHPTMIVSLKKMQYIDQKGTVFGSAQQPSELPLLTGVESLPPEELSKQIKLSLGLLEALKAKFIMKEINYHKYLGFTVKTEQPAIEIIFGFQPFRDKLKNLDYLMQESKKKSNQPVIIELDYYKKAFVQYQNNGTDTL